MYCSVLKIIKISSKYTTSTYVKHTSTTMKCTRKNKFIFYFVMHSSEIYYHIGFIYSLFDRYLSVNKLTDLYIYN